MSEASEVIREVHIQARPETVFAYFTDPARMVQWMGLEASLEAQPGGLFRVKINPERIARGEYLEVTPSRIVFSWGWEGREDVPPASSTVEVSLTPSEGGTLVRLRHYGLPASALGLHARSWEHNLPRLKTASESLK